MFRRLAARARSARLIRLAPSTKRPPAVTSISRLAVWLLSLLVIVLSVPAPVRAQQPASAIAEALSGVVTTFAEDVHAIVVAFRGESFLRNQEPGIPIALTSFQRTRRALVSVCGTAIIEFLIALIVLVSAEAPLVAVARAAERDVARSFWIGLLWQALATPLLGIVALALALTIILIPAIPIAMLLWALAYAGALTLGMLAVALVLGRAMLGRRSSHNRRALLSSLIVGLAVLTAVWLAAALLVSVPTIGILVRVLALAMSWVAATVGLGAVVRSRAGTVREHMETTTTEAAVPSWQTPTPVFGVVAARRPASMSSTTVE